MAAGGVAGAALDLGDVLPRGRSGWWGSLTALRRKPLGLVGVAIITVMAAIAIFAPVVAPYSPSEIRMGERLRSPELRHPFGTDNVGRDVFSRLVYGSRVSLAIGTMAVAVGTVAGALLGLVSGYVGGK